LSTKQIAKMSVENSQTNVNQLFADRFKSARLLNGLSLQDLADKLGQVISRQALHKYEKGEVIPDSEMLGRLSAALGVRPDYFFSEVVVELGELEFRKLKRLSVREQNRIIERTKDVLARYLELEAILGIGAEFHNPLFGTEVISSFEDVEKAAKTIRQKWHLGSDPISNCIELLEANHIKVVEVYSEEGFDGMQTFVNGKIPVIVFNASRMTAPDRTRFTVLHELGHLLMPLRGLDERQKETFCHQFAAAMLFPKEVAERELGRIRNKLLVPELGVLKQQYGISIQALAYRARDLGIITNSYLKQFMVLMGMNQWKVTEPVAYSGSEKSGRFRQLIYRALAEELISISKAAALTNQSLNDFRKQMMLVE
jgi:Zn-dependent peptidase ImmA (M78 family)/transcriptional regulator with XRE-family HTH domain